MKLKKLLTKSPKNFSDDDLRQPNTYLKLGSMEHPILHPSDLLKELLVSIIFHTQKKGMSCSSTDIKLYNLSDIVSGDFIGSFYALLQEGIYYGNIVGKKDIIACHPEAFCLEETNELFVPIGEKHDVCYALICNYAQQTEMLKPLHFVQTDDGRKNENVLHHFEEGTTIVQALKYCADQL